MAVLLCTGQGAAQNAFILKTRGTKVMGKKKKKHQVKEDLHLTAILRFLSKNTIFLFETLYREARFQILHGFFGCDLRLNGRTSKHQYLSSATARMDCIFLPSHTCQSKLAALTRMNYFLLAGGWPQHCSSPWWFLLLQKLKMYMDMVQQYESMLLLMLTTTMMMLMT